MKKELSVNDINKILMERFNCKSCFIESILVNTERGFKNIKIGAGGILDLHLELTD